VFGSVSLFRRAFLGLTLASLASLIGLSGCRGCGSSAPTASSSGADDALAPVASSAPSAPYLPARSRPDDSPAPLSEVEAVLFKLRPSLGACYRTSAATNPKLEGKALFEVTIAGPGTVQDVTLLSQNGLEPPLITCATGALKTATFKPTPDGGVASVKVPVAFAPPRTPPSFTDGGRWVSSEAGPPAR
jgi:hypothetical protein